MSELQLNLIIFLLFAAFVLVVLEWLRKAKDDALKAIDDAVKEQREVKLLLDELEDRRTGEQ